MAKSLNVSFSDGTSITYDDVPDEVTQDQANARAAEKYPDKQILGVSEGAHPEAPPIVEKTPEPQPSLGEQALATYKTAHDIAPISTEAATGAALIGAGNAIGKIPVVGPALGAVGRAVTPQPIQNLYSAAKNITGGINAWSQGQLNDALALRHQIESAGKAVPAELQGHIENMARQQGAMPKGTITPTASGVVHTANPMNPNLAPPAAPAPVPEAPPTSQNYMQRMTQLAERYMPAAKTAIGTAGKAIAPVARILGSAPVMGAQLALTPTGLNTNEAQELARRRAMAPTITP